MQDKQSDDEYLRSLMPNATEVELDAAKEAIADFLELIWKIKEEQEQARRDAQNDLDARKGAC